MKRLSFFALLVFSVFCLAATAFAQGLFYATGGSSQWQEAMLAGVPASTWQVQGYTQEVGFGVNGQQVAEVDTSATGYMQQNVADATGVVYTNTSNNGGYECYIDSGTVYAGTGASSSATSATVGNAAGYAESGTSISVVVVP